jgi:iron complex transport system permease protein
MSRRSVAIGWLAIVAALGGAVLLRLLVARSIGGGFAISWPGGELGSLRAQSALAAAAAGAALGAAGALLQSLLRNPLASPFVLGVTGGAGSGVAVASLLAAWAGLAAPSGAALTLPAAIGALGALGLVLLLARRAGGLDPVMLVLGGVVVGALASALSTVAESLLPPERRGMLAGWLFGRIPDAPDGAMLATCAASGLGLAALGAWLGPFIDAATLSDDEARASGVPLGALRAGLFVACGIATAATVVLCGPIAFVGLLAPHCARAAIGPRARALVPASACTGAALLVSADAFRQWIDIGGGRLPLGAVTAVLGGAAFLFLLRRTAGGWAR